MRTATMMLATILVLGSASVAVAECAWVLWTQETQKNAMVWLIESAFEDRDSCVRELDSEFNSALRRSQPNEKIKEAKANQEKKWIYIYYRDGKWNRTRYVCLPDTVRPRNLR